MTTRKFHQQQRRGSALIAVLICLLVVGLLVGGLVRAVALQQRQLRRQSWQLQASWLAESGAARARLKLNADADYKGETWQIAPAEMSGKDAGRVTIVVAPAADDAQQLTLTIEAIYPDDTIDRAQQRIELPVRVAPPGDPS